MDGDRFERQADLVPRSRITPVTVVGVGAIGRNLAIQLAAMGVPRIDLVDHDTVTITNITTQGYLAEEIGRPKVEVLADLLKKIDPNLEVNPIFDRWRPRYLGSRVVFACVDSIEIREIIWDYVASRIDFWCDGRMLGETIRVLCAYNTVTRAHYPTTLFRSEEATPGRCTAQSTIYAASVAAGIMASCYASWLRRANPPCDLTYNLLAQDLAVHD